jgi:phosphoenolpyruvate carboxylase
VTGNPWPLANRRVLGRAVQLRSPYVDALSLLQVRALRALRTEGASEGVTADSGEWVDGGYKDRWQHLLLLTVNGVSAGLQNTG